jgi:glutamate/tyrosine decarboxylase-like PLP-dependent enzyme
VGVAAIGVELIKWLAAQVGLPTEAGGLFVSGGSMANLTAMVVARDHRLKDHERAKGVAYFSDQSHFAVTRALKIIGLVDSQMRTIPSDSMFRMDMVELEKATTEYKAKGLAPFLVVANCGTTNVGAIDPLNEIANLARDQGMWMHVDGAYGASVALSKSHHSLLHELEHADNIAWDAHKWLLQTFGCAMVLVRDKVHLA